MKPSIHALLAVCLLVCATAPQISAQTATPANIEQLKEQVTRLNSVDTDASTPAELKEINRNFLNERRNRLRTTLQSTLDDLRNYRETMSNVIPPTEVKVVTDTIAELEKALQALGDGGAQPNSASSASITAPSSTTITAVAQGPCNPTQPEHFCLGAPTDNATDRALELVLGWTKPRKDVKSYFVEVSEKDDFEKLLFPGATVPPNPNLDGAAEFKLQKSHKLEFGQTYYWRVRANFTDDTSSLAMNGPRSFTTTHDFFSAWSKKGFKLQKALTGPDKGELAEVAFLSTIGEKTVFSTNFALSWERKRVWNWGRTNIRPSFSIEGSLASDESEAEDAWRFRLSGIFVTNFMRCKVAAERCPPNQFTRPTILSLYYKGSLKLEGDKDFDVRKLSGEFLITPNSFALAMGTARPGNPSKPLQFQWRPFFRLDAGHTFRRGTSEEREDTILRLVPRVRARVDLQFLRQWLNMSEVAIFADETFYYLPLENQRKRNNFFTSGIEFKFTPNLGFGLTYKNGRSAPKFEKINTLQGVVGVRF